MTHPLIIAVETSGRRGSVAIAKGAHLLADAEFAADRDHARDLLPTLDGLLQAQGRSPADVEHCYVSIGPGSFTGLRVAVTFARHLATASGVKLCAVPTLSVIAQNARVLSPPPSPIAVMLDAKSKRVFGSVFAWNGTSYQPIAAPVMAEPELLLNGMPRAVGVMGEGVPYHEAAIRLSGTPILDPSLNWPSARVVHEIGWMLAEAGEFTLPVNLVPYYLRRPEAEVIWERRHGVTRSE